MVKRFSVLSIVLVMLLPLSSAADLTTEISGEYLASGTYVDKESVDYHYYSHELDLRIKAGTPDAFLTIQAGIIDETWGDNPRQADMDFDRCWITKTFDADWKLEVGKMTGRDWGTMLGNNSEFGYYRVKVTRSIGDVDIIGYLQKNVEVGEENPDSEDAERDDSDTYSLGLHWKVGPVNLMPKVIYSDDSSVGPQDRDFNGTQTLELIFAATGKAGPFVFETEVNYIDVETDYPSVTEYSLYNIWADLRLVLDPVTLGLSAAYGTEDEGMGTGSFGRDFAPMIIMDNKDGEITNLGAMHFTRLYAEAHPLEGMTTGCAVLYGEYETDAYTSVTDSHANAITEINLTGSYQITEHLSYYAGIAWADLEVSRDRMLRIEHELAFRF